MRITVQVDPSLAKGLQGGTVRAEDAGLRQLVQRYAGELEPMHPGADDPVFQSFFVVNVSDSHAAELLRELQQHPAVRAAYAKPPDAPP